MTTKPIAVWCVCTKEGRPIPRSSAETRKDSIKQFQEQFVEFYDWSYLKVLGWQVKRFILSEAEGEV